MAEIKQERIMIDGIPTIIWGEKSEKAWLHVHGKCSRKEYAEEFATLAQEHGAQTISFDLPSHGERIDEGVPCDIWHGMHDVQVMNDWVKARWPQRALFACSLGAYFCLQGLNDQHFEQCLFQSPITNMEGLIRSMFKWFNVTEEELREKQFIPTPVDILNWDYYTWVKAHPLTRWNIPTSILYGSLDNLQEQSWQKAFAKKFVCELTIAEGCEHPFMKPEESKIALKWMQTHVK